MKFTNAGFSFVVLIPAQNETAHILALVQIVLRCPHLGQWFLRAVQKVPVVLAF
jgi:hypothetical protein